MVVGGSTKATKRAGCGGKRYWGRAENFFELSPSQNGGGWYND